MTTLHTLDIPQEPAALGRWLEQQLLGLNLASTIAELSAVHGPPAREQTLDELLGPNLDRALRDGLQSLPLPLLQGLLRDPQLLLPLQELVFLEGSGYWEVRHASPELQQLVSAGWERLQPQLHRNSAMRSGHTSDSFPAPAASGNGRGGDQKRAGDMPPENGHPEAILSENSQAQGSRQVMASPQPPQVRQAPAAPRRQQAGWWSHPLLVSALSAAAAVVTITFADHYYNPGAGPTSGSPLAVNDPASTGQQPTEDPAAVAPPANLPEESSPAPGENVASTGPMWGWNRPDAIDPSLPPGEYLNRLAEAAAEWNAETPQSVAGLARRIAEFRLGCSRLLTAEHQPLPAAEKQVLLDRCRKWADSFDKQLTAVEQLPPEATAEELAAEQAKMDTLVSKLVGRLREQAAQLS